MTYVLTVGSGLPFTMRFGIEAHAGPTISLTSTRVHSGICQVMATLAQHLRSAVTRLFTRRSPTNIARFVSSAVVNPVKRQSGPRLRADMVEEGLEVIDPLVADGDTSAAIVFPSWIFGVEATVLHPCPGGVLRSTAFTVGNGKRNHCRDTLRSSLSGKATTGPSISSLEFGRINRRLGSAIASTQPTRTFGYSLHRLDYGQSSETLPSKVDESAHTASYRKRNP